MSEPADQVDTSNEAINELCQGDHHESVLAMLRALQEERNALQDEVTNLLMDPEEFRAPIKAAELVAAIDAVRAAHDYFQQCGPESTRYVIDMDIDLAQVVQHLNEAALPTSTA